MIEYICRWTCIIANIVDTFQFKGAVCLSCLREWSHLSSLCNENKLLVILQCMRNQYWYVVKNSIKWTIGKSLSVVLYTLCSILSTEHLWKYTYECIANGSSLSTCVQTFRFCLFYFTALLHIKLFPPINTDTVGQENFTKARTVLYTAVHGSPFWCMYHNTSSHPE